MRKILLPLLFLSLAVPYFGMPAYADTSVLTADKPAGNKDEGGEKKEEGSKKGGNADVSGGRFAGDPIYIHISPMVLPVINENGVEQLVTLIFTVQVKDFDAADAMHSNMPRVMDALMRALYGGLGQGSLRKGKLVDVPKIKAKAITAVGEVIGTDNITDILVQSISQRLL